VQFSVASILEPGSFDLDSMASDELPGLCFFMSLPGPSNPVKAFNYMVETAQCVVKNLGGELLDEGRSVVTLQTLEHARQTIRDFERRQLAHQR
jgi:cell division protein ZipA